MADGAGPAAGVGDEQELLEVEPVVRRVVGARVSGHEVVEDLVQETLVRVLEARPRLEHRSLLPYAVVTARNLAVTSHRQQGRDLRNRHRVVDLRVPPRPEEEVLRREEAAAVGAALSGLSSRDRDTFLAHTERGASTAAIAQRVGSTPGGVAVGLARTRARLRVDYLLALRRVELPTARCRPVLIALSAGDRRRQQALDAGGHLMACATCASLSAPLIERRSAIAGLLPLGVLLQLLGPLRGPAVAAGAWVAGVWRRITQWLHAHQPAAIAGAVAVGAVGAVVVTGALAQRGPALEPPPDPPPAPVTQPPQDAPPPPPPPQPAGDQRLVVDGLALPVPWSVSLGEAQGAAQGRGLPVQAVDADEGFWVGGSVDRVWVRLVGPGESPVAIADGQLVDLDGRVVAHPPGFAAAQGVTDEEGAARLDAQGAHLEVDYGAVTVASP